MENRPYKHRDISWLYFNQRVLQEAEDPNTPPLERLKFLAIFSSNLDEFFKVRISQLRQLKSVDKELRKKLMTKANKTLKFILKTVANQQEQFGRIISKTLSELEGHGIYIKRNTNLSQQQQQFVQNYFDTEVKQYCSVIDIVAPQDVKDSRLYLIVVFNEHDFDTITIPSKSCGRFIELPGEDHQYIYLDDILRANIQKLFPNKTVKDSFSIKMSRDAQLYLEDDYTNTELVEKIYQSLGKRKSGQPTRLLYDINMPDYLIQQLKQALDLSDVDMMAGGRYHNTSDFFAFPTPEGKEDLLYKALPALQHPSLSQTTDIFGEIKKKDQLVHFPYQEFSSVENFISAAATDPSVTSIKLSLYRIAKTSQLTDSILKALENKKEVVVFVEAQARFDEENNIKWGRIFKEKGANVIFSVPNIKVHSKIALVERFENEILTRYAYIGTGNFNAKTAKLYCDHGLFTAHKKITSDLAQVFDVLERKLIIPKLKHLLVSPFTTRSTFLELIQNEILFAQAGKPAKITAKMNSLEDSKMISALYRASEAGVEVTLLVRGFCCLINRRENLSKNEVPIKITSIIDRYLEHGRIYLFENGGKKKMFIGSADWMTRNLDRRIEVLTPILDSDVFQELEDILAIQLSDNVKARILDAEDSNTRVVPKEGEPTIRSQYAIYDYLRKKLNEDN
ncbi:polyphosphate kinase 1 [Croceivirga thetidis]|uniref:Polyphosphate kinase n=1 Tax=Croceivirga thetidis TaxID=2721623 RepID=A0ABX1GR22_9FLAO|nr:polyphosphate kinase 1 [Croceivirga thetidis]NKI32378.1 polyphosphate kinase 1 [Croceivirga thetidis]